MFTLIYFFKRIKLFVIGCVLILCTSLSAVAIETNQITEAQRKYDQAKERRAALERQARHIETFLTKGQQISQKFAETISKLNEITVALPAVANWEALDLLTRKNFDSQSILVSLKMLTDETSILVSDASSNTLVESGRAMKEKIAPNTLLFSQMENTVKMSREAVKNRLERERPGMINAMAKDQGEVDSFLLQVKIRYIMSDVETLLEKLKDLDLNFGRMTQQAQDNLRVTREEIGKLDAQLQYLRFNYPVKDK